MWPAITQARPAPQLQLRRLGLLRWPPRLWGPREGWTTFIFLLLAHLAVVWSVERAQYVTQLPDLTVVTVLALSTGLALAKIAAPDVLLFPLGVVVGLPIALWRTALTVGEAEGLWQQAQVVVQRSTAWWELAIRGGISGDTLPFALLLAALSWLIGYLAAWSVFRYRHPWLALLPSGLGLVVNLSYLPSSFYSYLALYLVFSMIFLARLHMAERQLQWQEQGLGSLPAPANTIIVDGIWLTAALLLLAWFLPHPRPSATVAEWWLQLTKPWQKTEQEFNRVFASLRSHRAVPLHTYGNTFALRGSVVLGQQPVMRLTASDYGTYRVRATTYDAYTGQGWMANQRREVPPEIVVNGASPDTGQKIATATIELEDSTGVLFSVGEPIQVNVPITADLGPGRFYLAFSQTGSSFALPLQNDQALAELKPGEIRTLNNGFVYNPSSRSAPTSTVLTEGEVALRQALLEGSRSASPSSYRTISFYRSSPLEVAALRATPPLSRGDVYTVTSFISGASVEDLRKAPTTYPAWTDYYKQLPVSLPQSVRELAREVTVGFDNAYDRALSIQEYLRKIEYSFDIQPPPANTDAVSFFLFQQKKGYCDYYASAMAVMLRAVGIPARVVVGYVLTKPDTENPNGFVVTGEDAHSWPEAYFPGYGWIEFEPTPARTLALRPEETALSGGISGSQGASEDSDSGGEATIDVPLTIPAPASREVWAIGAEAIFILLGGSLVLSVVFWVFWWRTLLGLPYPAQVFEQMVRLGAWLRVPALPQQTPSEYAQRLKVVLPSASAQVDQVTASYNEMRFGRRLLDQTGVSALTDIWRELRRRLLLKLIRWKDV